MLKRLVWKFVGNVRFYFCGNLKENQLITSDGNRVASTNKLSIFSSRGFLVKNKN